MKNVIKVIAMVAVAAGAMVASSCCTKKSEPMPAPVYEAPSK